MNICCPNCQSINVTWREKKQSYTCENCDQEFLANKEFIKQKHWREYRDEAFSLLKSKHYEPAIEIMQQGAIVAKKDFGNGNIEHAEAIAELGYLFASANKTHEAVPYLKLAIGIYEELKAITREHVDSYWNLGFCFNKLQDCYQADLYFRLAIKFEIKYSQNCTQKLEKWISLILNYYQHWRSDNTLEQKYFSDYLKSIHENEKKNSKNIDFWYSFCEYYEKNIEAFIQQQLIEIPIEKRLNAPSYFNILKKLSFSTKWPFYEESLSFIEENQGNYIQTYWILVDYILGTNFRLENIDEDTEIRDYVLLISKKAVQFAKNTGNREKEEHYSSLLAAAETKKDAGSDAQASDLQPWGYSKKVENYIPKITENQTEQIACSLYSVAEASCGDIVFIQVFAHLLEKRDEAANYANANDPDSSMRQSSLLEEHIDRGAKLSFSLEIKDIEVEDPVQHLVWQGETDSVQYDIEIPENYNRNLVIGKVSVTSDSVPIGHFKFKIKILDNRNKQVSIEPNLQATEMNKYRYAFISYSSKDRDEVLRRVQMLDQFKIGYFQDILTLNPGERWEQEIYKHIDLADVFFLFWSVNARDSEWVIKEVEYALERKKESTSELPEILPVIIEKPPVTEPPESLKDIHFNDKIMYFIGK